jgi:hypothetical protein
MTKGTGRDKSLDKSGSKASSGDKTDKPSKASSGDKATSRTSPITIKSIGEDMRMNILETAFKFPEEIENKTIEEYKKIKGEYREGR